MFLLDLELLAIMQDPSTVTGLDATIPVLPVPGNSTLIDKEEVDNTQPASTDIFCELRNQNNGSKRLGYKFMSIELGRV